MDVGWTSVDTDRLSGLEDSLGLDLLLLLLLGLELSVTGQHRDVGLHLDLELATGRRCVLH